MSNHLLYIPFPRKKGAFKEHAYPFLTQADDTNIQVKIAQRANRPKDEKWFIRFKNESLSGKYGWKTNNKFRIFVVGHCDSGSSTLDVGSYSFLKRVLPNRLRQNSICTYQDLIRQLQTLGLPEDFPGKIIIYSCSSGSSLLGMKSFTFKFNREMRALDYNNCNIYGYTASVTLGYVYIGRGVDREIHKGAPRSFRIFRKKGNKFVRARTKRIEFPTQNVPQPDEQIEQDENYIFKRVEPSHADTDEEVQDYKRPELPPADINEDIEGLRFTNTASEALADASEID